MSDGASLQDTTKTRRCRAGPRGAALCWSSCRIAATTSMPNMVSRTSPKSWSTKTTSQSSSTTRCAKPRIDAAFSPATTANVACGKATSHLCCIILRCAGLSSTMAQRSGAAANMRASARAAAARGTRGRCSAAVTPLLSRIRSSVPPSARAQVHAMGKPSPADVDAPRSVCARSPSALAMRLNSRSPSATRRAWPTPAALRTSRRSETQSPATSSTMSHSTGGEASSPYLNAFESRLSSTMLTSVASSWSARLPPAAVPAVGSRTTARCELL
mmetsp:Transcript_16687/g.57085  ORF Transcript_16687/g.57085 Transcript_16687/m.57085 type:complete len:273 (-) Transcript_16687:1974-2792(-)